MKFVNVSCLFVLSVLFVFTQGLSIVKNTSGHDIIDGNCTNATYNDRVYYDHVDKAGIPLFVRSEDVNYQGDREIYCIQALNQKNNDTGGSAEITDGGVGHRFVKIDLESYRGHGLEYYVSIYARNTTAATSKVFKPPMVQELLNKN